MSSPEWPQHNAPWQSAGQAAAPMAAPAPPRQSSRFATAFRGIRPEGWLFSVISGLGSYWLIFGVMAAATFAGTALVGTGLVQQFDISDSPITEYRDSYTDGMGQSVPWFALLVMWAGQAFFGGMSLHLTGIEDSGALNFHLAGPNLTGFITVALLLYLGGRLAERLSPSFGTPQRVVQSVLTGLVLMLFVLFMPVFAQYSTDIEDFAHIRAHSVSFIATVAALLVGAFATFAGRHRQARAAPSQRRGAIIAGEAVRTLGVFGKQAFLCGGVVTLVVFILVAVKSKFLIALGLFVLRPLDFVADAFTFGLFGGMHLSLHAGGSGYLPFDLDDLVDEVPEATGNFTAFNIPGDSPTWYVPIVLALVMAVTCVLASVHRLAVMNRSTANPAGVMSWLFLPAAYLALTALGFFVLRLGFSAKITGAGEDNASGTVAVGPTWWVLLTAPAIGLVVEVLARFVAPRIAGAFTPGTLAVLAARPVFYPEAVTAGAAQGSTAYPSQPASPAPNYPSQPGSAYPSAPGTPQAAPGYPGQPGQAGAGYPSAPGAASPSAVPPAPAAPAAPPAAPTGGPNVGSAHMSAAYTPPPAVGYPSAPPAASAWPGQSQFQAAQSAATSQTAPNQPAPWTPEQKRKAKRYGLVTLVVLVVLALAGTGTGIYLSGSAKSRQVKSAAQDYLTALREGDGNALEKLDKTSGGSAAREGLGADVYSAAGDKITDFQVLNAKRGGGGYTVATRVKQGGKQHDVNLVMKQDGKKWKVQSGLARRMVVAVPAGTENVQVNGQDLTFKPQVLDGDTTSYIKDKAQQDPAGWHQLSLLLYPGKYEISAPAEQSYFQNGTSGAEVTADGSTKVIRTHFKKELSKYFKDQAEEAVHDKLGDYECSGPNPGGCPFSIAKAGDYAGNNSNVSWSVDTYPEFEDPVLRSDGTAYMGTKTSLQGTVTYADTSDSPFDKDRKFECAFEADFTIPEDDSEDEDDDDYDYDSDYNGSLEVSFRKANTSFP